MNQKSKDEKKLYGEIEKEPVPEMLKQECVDFPKMAKAALLMHRLHRKNVLDSTSETQLLHGMLRSFVDYGPSSDLRLSRSYI